MPSATQLYKRMLDAPSRPVQFRVLEQCLLGFGFEQVRIRGSHRSYKHPLVQEVLTVQPKGKDVQPYQVRKFLAMVKEFDLKPDD